jgi:hypothetical protein
MAVAFAVKFLAYFIIILYTTAANPSCLLLPHELSDKEYENAIAISRQMHQLLIPYINLVFPSATLQEYTFRHASPGAGSFTTLLSNIIFDTHTLFKHQIIFGV